MASSDAAADALGPSPDDQAEMRSTSAVDPSPPLASDSDATPTALPDATPAGSSSSAPAPDTEPKTQTEPRERGGASIGASEASASGSSAAAAAATPAAPSDAEGAGSAVQGEMGNGAGPGPREAEGGVGGAAPPSSSGGGGEGAAVNGKPDERSPGEGPGRESSAKAPAAGDLQLDKARGSQAEGTGQGEAGNGKAGVKAGDKAGAASEDGLERSASGRTLNAAAPEFVPRALSQSLPSPGAPSPTSPSGFAFPAPGPHGAYAAGVPGFPGTGAVPGHPSQPLLPLPLLPPHAAGAQVLIMGAPGAPPAAFAQGAGMMAPAGAAFVAGQAPVGGMAPHALWQQQQQMVDAHGRVLVHPGQHGGAGGRDQGNGWMMVEGHHHGHGPHGQHGHGHGQGHHNPNHSHHQQHHPGQQNRKGPHPNQHMQQHQHQHQGQGTNKRGNQEAAEAHFKALPQEELDALKANILRQVEFYFGDTNLATDNHLQKLIRNDKEGLVHLRAILDFKKMRSMVPAFCAGTQAYVALAASALAASTALVLNEQGNKVRRAVPMPEVDPEEIQRRTVIAENLPEDHSVASMEQLFGKAGRVKMVRICSPQATNGANTKARFVVTNKLHALIEYETVEEAEAAASQLNDSNNWRSGLHVRVLLPRAIKNKFSHHNNQHHAHKPGAEGQVGAPASNPQGAASLASDGAGATASAAEGAGQAQTDLDQATGGEGTEEGPQGAQAKGARAGKGKGKGKRVDNRAQHSKSPSKGGPVHHGHPHPHPHPHAHSGVQGEGQSKSRGSSPARDGTGHGHAHGHGHGSSPLRGGSGGTGAGADAAHPVKPLPGPRMPDGTRGFSMGRGKPLTPPPSAPSPAAPPLGAPAVPAQP